MNMAEQLLDARSIMTLVSLLTFLGIVYWTYVAHRKQDFDEAAMLPFADEDTNTMKQEPRHG
jgi:cytochrome c oxidase cbb3-type subunit 4